MPFVPQVLCYVRVRSSVSKLTRPSSKHVTEMFHLSYIIKEKKPRSSENKPTVPEKSMCVIDDFFFRPRAHFFRRTFFLHNDRVSSARGGGYEGGRGLGGYDSQFTYTLIASGADKQSYRLGVFCLLFLKCSYGHILFIEVILLDLRFGISCKVDKETNWESCAYEV